MGFGFEIAEFIIYIITSTCGSKLWECHRTTLKWESLYDNP